MRLIAAVSVLAVVLACGKSDSNKGGPTSAETPTDPIASEITALVLADLGSNAFGNLELEPSCVTVSSPATASDGAVVVAARVAKSDDCASSEYLWVYSRAQGATTWADDFLGSPPACWKGVPANLAAAVAKASGIALCE